MKQSTSKSQSVKKDLDKIELYQMQQRLRSAKQKADAITKAFLGKHYFTSEPCGLVF